MEEKITQLVQYLNKLFLGALVTSSLAGVLSVLAIPQIYGDTQTGMGLQSAAILILLTGIPLTLKLHYKKLTETLPENDDQRISLISKWFIIRLILITATFVFNVVVYSLTGNVSSIFCSLIAFMALLFFCKPNRTEIVDIFSKNNL